MNTRAALVAGMLIGGLALAACGGSTGPTSATGSATPAPQPSTAASVVSRAATEVARPSGDSERATAKPLWAASVPPEGGTSVQGAQWVRFPGPGGTQMYAAVFRPSGAGPFPAVVVLHGTEGFRATHDIQFAADVSASGGLVTVAACWFGGNWSGAGPNADAPVGATYPDGVNCPDAPVLPADPTSAAAQAAVSAIVEMTRTLPGVAPEKVGLFGHSRGSAAVVAYGLHTGGVSGVVAAAGYPLVAPGSVRARPSMLILQGASDTQVSASIARRFESALRSAGLPVESQYYEGAGHDLYYIAPTHADAVSRVAAFFKR